MSGISDLPKFNYEDLEDIVVVGQGSFGVVFKAESKVHSGPQFWN